MGTAASELYDLTPTTSVVVKIKNRIGNEKIITNAAKLFNFCYAKNKFFELIQGCVEDVAVMFNNSTNMSNWYTT